MTIAITAVPQNDLDPTTGAPLPPAQLLTVTVTNTAPNAVPPNTAVTLWRVHADGTEHRVMVASQPRVSPTIAVRLDYHCPYNVPVTYRVDIGAASATVDAWLDSEVSWLIPPSDVANAVAVTSEEIVTFGDRATPSRAFKMTPIGGKSVFKSDGARDGVNGSLVLRVLDETPYRNLFADDEVILVNTIADESWDLTWLWAQPDPQYSNPVGLALYKKRIITIALQESGDPDLDLSSPWTCGAMATAMAAEGITCGTLSTIYASCLDLSLNRRI